MSDHSDFQKDFVSSITQEISIESVLNKLVPAGKLTKEEVLDVYRKDYFARLTEALGENFEAIWAVLGDEGFFILVREYLKNNPSTACDLGAIGQDLPDYLMNNDFLEDYPFIVDLAKFEIAFRNTFHLQKTMDQQGENPMAVESFADTRFEFADHLTYFEWAYRIKDIWLCKEKGFDNSDEDFFQYQAILMFRGKENVMMLDLSKSQLEIFKRLSNGSTLNESLESLEIEVDEIQYLFLNFQKFHLIKKFISP